MTLTAKWVPDDDGIGRAAVIQGGIIPAPSWSEYAARWPDPEVPNALREAVIREGLETTTGDEANDGHFALSDGRRITLTQRAWGDLVQSIADRREGYMVYYTRGIYDDEVPQ